MCYGVPSALRGDLDLQWHLGSGNQKEDDDLWEGLMFQRVSDRYFRHLVGKVPQECGSMLWLHWRPNVQMHSQSEIGSKRKLRWGNRGRMTRSHSLIRYVMLMIPTLVIVIVTSRMINLLIGLNQEFRVSMSPSVQHQHRGQLLGVGVFTNRIQVSKIATCIGAMTLPSSLPSTLQDVLWGLHRPISP
jgi:hypothetical protein